MFGSRKSPTNETAGRFVRTGDYADGSSFLFDDGKTRAVFHSFTNPKGTKSFTGLVPAGLRGGFADNAAAIAAVEALNA